MVSQVGGILLQENISGNIDLPSYPMVAEKKIDDSDMYPVGSSVALEESKGYKDEMDDRMTVCGVVPGTASGKMDLPQCPSSTEDENIEGLSEKGPVGSLVAVEESNDQMNVPQVCGIVQVAEEISLPSSSKMTEEEKVEDSSDMGPFTSSAAQEE